MMRLTAMESTGFALQCDKPGYPEGRWQAGMTRVRDCRRPGINLKLI
jgi:hypothetical protein